MQYMQRGGIAFLKGNVYSNMPFLTEMLFLQCLGLETDPLAGAQLAQGLVGAFGLLAAAAVAVLAGGAFGRRAGRVACALFYTMPWVFTLSIKAYVGLPLAFLSVVAVHLALRAIRETRGARRFVVASAVVVGLAMGVKYTAFLFIYPAFAVLIIGGCVSRRTKLRAVDVLLAVLVPVLVVSPWLVKNLLATANPVYPLLYNVFGGRDWSALKDARWMKVHSPGDPSLAGTLDGLYFALSAAVFADWRVSVIVAVLLVLAFARKPLRGTAATVMGFAAWMLFAWLLATQRIARFLFPAAPFVVAAASLGFVSARGRALRVAAFALVIVILFLNAEMSLSTEGATRADWSGRVPAASASGEDGMLAVRSVFGAGPAWKRAAENSQSRWLAIGEVRNFLSPANFMTSTVFDGNLLDELLDKANSLEALRDGLVARGVTRIFINWRDINMLWHTNYVFTHEGRRHMGFSDRVFPGCDLFARMAERGLLAPMASWGEVETESGPVPAYEVFAVRPGPGRD